VHDRDAWNALDVTTQERIIGRGAMLDELVGSRPPIFTRRHRSRLQPGAGCGAVIWPMPGWCVTSDHW